MVATLVVVTTIVYATKKQEKRIGKDKKGRKKRKGGGPCDRNKGPLFFIFSFTNLRSKPCLGSTPHGVFSQKSQKKFKQTSSIQEAYQETPHIYNTY